MVNIRVKLDRSGLIRHIDSQGHIQGKRKGENILCSAITILLRTAERAVRRENTIKSVETAPREGVLSLEILSYPDNKKEWLKGFTDFLLTGLTDIAREHTESIHLTITETEKGR